jgi:hypothetical protein
MNIDKSKKRIAKKVKMGDQGYPVISINYFGATAALAEDVVITLVLEEGSEAMEQRLVSKADAREDETIQSSIVKMIERCDAKTVKLNNDVTIKS